MSLDRMKISGIFYFKYLEDNKIIYEEMFKNVTMITSLNSMLDNYFSSSWYLGLKATSETPVNTWTASQIGSVFTEFTNYSESTRVLWNKASASSGIISNLADYAEFTISSDGNINGAFLINDSTKNGTSGILHSCSNLSVTVPVYSGGTVEIGYAIQIQN